MRRFGVLEEGIVSQTVAAGLTACGISFVQLRPPERCRDDRALLIVPPGLEGLPAEKPQLRVRYLLIPGKEEIFGIEADCAVSYGLSAQDSITVSSLQEDRLVLSLQRELVTLPGYVLDRQEVCLPRPASLLPEETISIYGALLMLGVPVEKLQQCINSINNKLRPGC